MPARYFVQINSKAFCLERHSYVGSFILFVNTKICEHKLKQCMITILIDLIMLNLSQKFHFK